MTESKKLCIMFQVELITDTQFFAASHFYRQLHLSFSNDKLFFDTWECWHAAENNGILKLN